MGITQFGVPVFPDDCCDWCMDGGYLQSPTCIADRAATMAARRVAATIDAKISAVTERLDMTGIDDVKKSTTIGDLKLTVNKIKAKVGGKTVPTVLSCLVAMMSFAGEIGVWKANINDVGDSEIVTNVTVTGTFISSATQLTEKVEFFDNLRTNYERDVTAAFSNAVNSKVAHQALDATKATGVRELLDDIRTNGTDRATEVSAFSNLVQAVSSNASVSASRLTSLDTLFDDVRTGKVTAVTVSFSNAVAGVSVTGPFYVVDGSVVPVVINAGGVSLSATRTVGGLQDVVDVKGVLRIPDRQALWIGGEVVDGKVIGGETAFSAYGSGGSSSGGSEITGEDEEGNTLSVRYDMTAVVIDEAAVRTNSVQWSLAVADSNISGKYNGAVLVPESPYENPYNGDEWSNRGSSLVYWARMWYDGSSWKLYVSYDGYGGAMMFTTAGSYSDTTVSFSGHPSSAPALTYYVVATRGETDAYNSRLVMTDGPVRKRIATEDYADAARSYISSSTNRVDADLSVRVQCQTNSESWTMSVHDGVSWTNLCQLSWDVGGHSLDGNYGSWAASTVSDWSGHTITNSTTPLHLTYNNGYWFFQDERYVTYFQYYDTFPWNCVKFEFTYRGELYRLTRPIPWGLPTGHLATREFVESCVSADSNGVSVVVEPHIVNGSVEWRVRQ